MQHWMIYGAAGYTGRLITELAIQRGLRPILAGRSESKVRDLAQRTGLPWRSFDLGDGGSISAHLKDVALVLHCAGPFSVTSAPMVDACIRQRVHYLDITGEIEVFEEVHKRGNHAAAAGCMLLPGVGFDIVATDCLAAALARRLPEASHLELAIAPAGRPSPGTLKTAIEGIPKGGMVRVDGQLQPVSASHATRTIDFGGRRLWTTAIPWGDVSTAFYSTGIPNITVFAALPRSVAIASRWLAPIARIPGVTEFLKRQVEKHVKGPSESERERGKILLWGRVAGPTGSAEGRLEVLEGYRFTAFAALAAVQRVLGGSIKPGFATPSLAFGPEFVLEIPGSQWSLS